MPRCSLKKLVISIVTVTTLGWAVFLFYNYVFAMRQKSILRYQIEQELSRHVCVDCLPSNSKSTFLHDRMVRYLLSLTASYTCSVGLSPTHIHTHACTHIHAHTYMYTHAHTYMYTHTHTPPAHTHVHTYTHVHTHTTCIHSICALTHYRYWDKKLEPQTDDEKEEEKRGFQNNGFNQFRSDRLPLDREVPDTRDPR